MLTLDKCFPWIDRHLFKGTICLKWENIWMQRTIHSHVSGGESKPGAVSCIKEGYLCFLWGQEWLLCWRQCYIKRGILVVACLPYRHTCFLTPLICSKIAMILRAFTKSQKLISCNFICQKYFLGYLLCIHWFLIFLLGTYYVTVTATGFVDAMMSKQH